MAITSSLEGGSAIADQLGQGHIVAGKFTCGAGTDAVLTCNDRSAVLTRTAAGDYTVTFGDTFTSAPMAFVQAVRATFATSAIFTAEVLSVGTATLHVSAIVTSLTGTATTTLAALSDGGSGDSIHFTLVGKRYN